jgi:hypothetical protein
MKNKTSSSRLINQSHIKSNLMISSKIDNFIVNNINKVNSEKYMNTKKQL